MTANPKHWRLAGGIGYLALFLYFFVLSPAPPQVISSGVAVDAPAASLAALMCADGASRSTAVKEVRYFASPLQAQLLRLVAGRPVSAASLLLRSQTLKVWSENAGETAVLKAEMSWTVRGGRLGKVLDNLLSRCERSTMLHQSLAHYKEMAEGAAGSRIHRASLGVNVASLN